MKTRTFLLLAQALGIAVGTAFKYDGAQKEDRAAAKKPPPAPATLAQAEIQPASGSFGLYDADPEGRGRRNPSDQVRHRTTLIFQRLAHQP